MNKLSKLKSADYTNSFNHFVYKEVKENSKCLDVGCWSGNLGAKLINNKNCIVDGIDMDKRELALALRKGFRKTYTINLNTYPEKLKQLKDRYDVIIFSDVLEHLIDPQFILKRLKKNLSDNGYIIVSLPNVAFLLNRLQLLFGRWEYREYGTLDKTHLRFYTISSLIKLVESAGYKVEKVVPYNQFGVLRFLWPLDKIFPTLLAYQVMIKAK